MAEQPLREGDVVEWPESRNRYQVVRIFDDGGVVLERHTGAAEEVVLLDGPAQLAAAVVAG